MGAGWPISQDSLPLDHRLPWRTNEAQRGHGWLAWATREPPTPNAESDPHESHGKTDVRQIGGKARTMDVGRCLPTANVAVTMVLRRVCLRKRDDAGNGTRHETGSANAKTQPRVPGHPRPPLLARRDVPFRRIRDACPRTRRAYSAVCRSHRRIALQLDFHRPTLPDGQVEGSPFGYEPRRGNFESMFRGIERLSKHGCSRWNSTTIHDVRGVTRCHFWSDLDVQLRDLRL